MITFIAEVEVVYPDEPGKIVKHTLTGLGNDRYVKEFPSEDHARKAIKKFYLDTLCNPAFVANARLVRSTIYKQIVHPYIITDFEGMTTYGNSKTN